MRKCPKCFSRYYDLRMESMTTMRFKDGKLLSCWHNTVTSRIADCIICGYSWDIDEQDEQDEMNGKVKK